MSTYVVWEYGFTNDYDKIMKIFQDRQVEGNIGWVIVENSCVISKKDGLAVHLVVWFVAKGCAMRWYTSEKLS